MPLPNHPTTQLSNPPHPPHPPLSTSRVADAGLTDIFEKLEAGVRLGLDDGIRLFEAPDLLAVGWLANRDREKRHGRRTYFNYNLRLEPTHVCQASCLFFSF